MQSTTIVAPQLTTLATTVGTILASPPTSCIVSAITFANKTGAAVTIQCSIYNGTTDFYLAFNAPIAPGDTLVLGGTNLKITLTNGFSLRALCSAATSVDATVSSTQFT